MISKDKYRIEFEVCEIIADSVIGRIVGSNVHLGDFFDEIYIEEYLDKKIGSSNRLKEIILADVKIDVLQIHCHRRNVDWLHAPHTAAIKIPDKYLEVVGKNIMNGFSSWRCLYLSGPYSKKTDVTGKGYFT